MQTEMEMVDDNCMGTPVVVDQTNLTNRRAAAKNRLNNNELAEAVRLYAHLLRDFPEDIESLITLGNLYLAIGDGKSARSLYKQAEKLDPNSRVIQCQLQLTNSPVCEGDPEISAAHPSAIARLIQELTGVKQESEEQELTRAADLLDQIIHSGNPAEQVLSHIDEINRLLPALVEINIRQAWSEGRPELVESLQALKQGILSQSGMELEDNPPVIKPTAPVSGAPTLHSNLRVLLLKSPSTTLSERLLLAEVALSTLGCEVLVQPGFNPLKDPLPDVAIISNPHAGPKVLEGMAALSASQIPIIVDLDDNFEQMPVSHPNYATAGLGIQTRYKAYNTALMLADMVTVNSEAIASSYKDKQSPIRMIPDGWDSQNPFWNHASSKRDTINLGWVSNTGQLEDLSLIRRVITRVIREFNNTQVLIIGDSQSYRLFETISESRRNYLPLLSSQEYPYQLGQIDILMVPLRNDPYHLSMSDKILVEAGAKGIPWIASPNLAFARWQAGGLIANTQEEWYVYLRQMVMNADIRQSFSQSGMIAAKSRESSRVGEIWLQVIHELVKAKKS